MLASKRSAGIVPEVNLRSPLHAGDKLFKQGSTLILKPRADVKCPKIGVSLVPQNGLMFSKNLIKKHSKKCLD